ncbi:MAG: hypothetical protein JO189_03730 [Deltaproteobacteria bacterium]|nr:hypothetical protein [Deltaproteobacteria bacterium]
MLTPTAVVERVSRLQHPKESTRPRRLQIWLQGQTKSLLIGALFALCIAPTFISYHPYTYTTDDAGYLQQSIKVSHLWSGSIQGFGISSDVHPPVMMLLGLPWGPLASWDAAGKCFISLATLISLLAALCLYLLLRIGIKPLFLVLAAVCVGASLGPYPHAGGIHYVATGFMADNLLAWTALAALLLIPYEARTPCPLMRGAVLRGIIWGSILSLGAMTKLSFLYFTGSIAALLFLVHFNRNGYRSTVAALIGFAFSSAPAALYLLLCGRVAIATAMATSFGTIADLSYVPILQFLNDTIRDAPGLLFSFTLTAGALVYLLIGRRSVKLWPDFVALSILIVFGMIVIKSPHREIRYELPVIVALAFLIAIFLSGKRHSEPRPVAALTAVLVFCGLVTSAVPMLHRADRESLAKSNAVLAQAAQCNAKHIIVGTDSPTLNVVLMGLAVAVSSNDSVEVGGLPQADEPKILGVPLISNDALPAEKGFDRLLKSDQVVFQNINPLFFQNTHGVPPTFFSKEGINGPFKRAPRVAEYEQYLRQSGYVPVKVDDDLNVYSIKCRP